MFVALCLLFVFFFSFLQIAGHGMVANESVSSGSSVIRRPISWVRTPAFLPCCRIFHFIFVFWLSLSMCYRYIFTYENRLEMCIDLYITLLYRLEIDLCVWSDVEIQLTKWLFFLSVCLFLGHCLTVECRHRKKCAGYCKSVKYLCQFNIYLTNCAIGTNEIDRER